MEGGAVGEGVLANLLGGMPLGASPFGPPAEHANTEYGLSPPYGAWYNVLSCVEVAVDMVALVWRRGGYGGTCGGGFCTALGWQGARGNVSEERS